MDERSGAVLQLGKHRRGAASRKKRRNSSLWLWAIILAALVVFFGFFLLRGRTVPGRTPPATPEFVRYLKANNVYDILVDPVERDRVWFATSEGIRQYDKNTGYWYGYGLHHGLPVEQVTSIACDSASVWFGTWQGLVRWERAGGSWTRAPKGEGTKSRRILALCPGSDGLWVSSMGRGVEKYDPESKTWTDFGKESGLGKGDIYDLLRMGDTLYGGGSEGTLYWLDPGESRWRSARNPDASSYVTKIWTLAKDSDALWMGTSHTGVWRFEPETKAWRTYRQRGASPLIMVYSLKVDGGTLWAGTPTGINRYEKKTDVWVRLENIDPLTQKPYVVTSLARDEDYVWVGTYEGGIGKCKKRNLETIWYSAGMEHDHVTTIGLDDTAIWLGYGFLGGYADYIRNDSLVWERNVNLWDGLPHENVSLIRCWKDWVFIGTWEGYAVKNRGSGKWINSRKAHRFDAEVKSLDRAGNKLLMGTGRGLYALRAPAAAPVLVDGSSNLDIKDLCMAGGQTWIAAGKAGLFRWDGKETPLVKLPLAGLPAFDVAYVAMWNGRLCFSNAKDQIYFLNPDETSAAPDPFGKLEPLDDDAKRETAISGLFAVDGRLWVATNRGIVIRDTVSSRNVGLDYWSGLLNSEVLTVASDSSYVYVGLFGGLNRIGKTFLEETIFKGVLP